MTWFPMPYGISYDEAQATRGAPHRVVCLDTETTGLSPATDRIIQIACVELLHGVTLGKKKSWLLNPGMPIPEEATRVHGITDAMVADARIFTDIADDLKAFIADSPIVAHNANFDMAFLEAELKRAGLPSLSGEVLDTLPLLRRLVGSGRATLDAGCKLFGISLDRRKDRHDALVDAELLAEMFGFLTGARKRSLFDGLGTAADVAGAKPRKAKITPPGRSPASYPDRGLGVPREAERAAHAQWKQNFGLPLILLVTLLGGCAAPETVQTTPTAQAAQTAASAPTRVEIRDEAKDITADDRIVRTAQQTTPATADMRSQPRASAGDPTPPSVPHRSGGPQQDIVDARALAVLSALLGGVPASPIIGPPPQHTGATPPPTGMSPVLHLIPRD